MPRRRLFRSPTPSTRVTRRRYPEEWAWWEASGWLMFVEDGLDGELHLFSRKQKANGDTVLWGANALADEIVTPDLVRLFLIETLYMHLHPRKAEMALGAFGMVCTDAELDAFVRRQQRKVVRLKKKPAT